MGESADRTVDQGAGRTADTNDSSGGNSRDIDWRAESRKWERLAKENGGRASELDERLKSLEDKDKSELQRAIERAEKAERDRAEAETRALRLDVASRKGLPSQLAARLRGKSKAELEADADELLTLVSKDGAGGKESASDGSTGEKPHGSNGVIRDPDQGRGSGEGATQSGSGDMNAWLRQAAGHSTRTT